MMAVRQTEVIDEASKKEEPCRIYKEAEGFKAFVRVDFPLV